MVWRYDPTPEEKAAAALLRDHGWRVSEPPCPDCHGSGIVNRSQVDEYYWIAAQCPRGCKLLPEFGGEA